MREIKFRAWDKDKQCMIKDALQHWKESFDVVTETFLTLLDDDKYEVMQYTGLKDAVGREIYEGDIVKCDDDLWVVLWDDYKSCFAIDGLYLSMYVCPFDVSWSNDCEVIGNIYENPELLEEET